MSYLLAQADARRLPLPDGCVDAVVTDPPAGIGFMGKTWDKPGVLGVSGGKAMPATMASRNPICRLCGCRQRGEPRRRGCECPAPDFDTTKSRRRERELFVGFLAACMAEARRVAKPGAYALVWALPRTSHWTALAVEEAGWVIRDRVSHLFGQGFPKAQSCLKPACEDWWLAWNPARRVPPLNIDGCRIETDEIGAPRDYHPREDRENWRITGGSNGNGATSPLGRWPANVTHDGSDDVLGAFAAFGDRPAGGWPARRKGIGYDGDRPRNRSGTVGERIDGDSGSAARFFYCAKASADDRGDDNTHPTVKSTELMRWLGRLITPPGGLILDSFSGSGSTGRAAAMEGFRFVGFDLSRDYLDLAARRIPAGLRPVSKLDPTPVKPLPGQLSFLDSLPA